MPWTLYASGLMRCTAGQTGVFTPGCLISSAVRALLVTVSHLMQLSLAPQCCLPACDILIARVQFLP